MPKLNKENLVPGAVYGIGLTDKLYPDGQPLFNARHEYNGPKLVFLDTETTGVNEEDRLVQVAFKVAGNGTGHVKLFKPPVPMNLEATAMNHITNKMLEYEEEFKGSKMQEKLRALFHDEKAVLVAHNAKFDIGFLNKEGLVPVKWICTLKMFHHMDAKGELPQYNLQFLRYYYGLDVEATAHDAYGDIVVLEELFYILHNIYSVDEMVEISKQPILHKRIPFGKYRNIHLSEVPVDYLQWMVGNMKLDEDMMYSLNYWINNKK